MEITPVHTLNVRGVLSESKRIVKANYGHFVALSLLFLPLSFSVIINPLHHLPGQFFTVDHFHKFPPNLQKPPITHLLYILIVYFLALCASATISTHSKYHAFLGNPIKFLTALNSLTVSFFPIVSTAIVAHILLFCISLSFLLFVGAIVMLAQNLGLVIDYNSIHFMWFSAVVGATLIVIIIYFQVNWSLAFVVVVAESKWGFAPLMRSSYLVKGMKSVSLLVLLYFGVCGALLVVVYTGGVLDDGMREWVFVFFTMLGSFFLMIMCLLRMTAANTVLYMYCKALHGELAIEIADDYINLPFDDEKV